MNKMTVGESENIRILKEAMARHRIIQFSYYGTSMPHRFAPHEIKSSANGLFVTGRTYLDGRSADHRNYTIEKMSDILITAQVFQLPKAFDRRKSDRNRQVIARAKTKEEVHEQWPSILDYLGL